MSAPTRPAHPPAGYRTLRVWQRALDVAVDAAHLARTLAAAGHERAATDLPRAAAAIPAHIAAGSTAGNRADYQRALAAALAAVARVETMVAMTERLAPDAAPACAALLANSADLTRQLRAFARVLSGAPAAAAPPSRRLAAPHGGPDDHAHAEPETAVPAADPPVVPTSHPTADATLPPAAPASAPPTAPPTAPVAAPMPTRPARARRTQPA